MDVHWHRIARIAGLAIGGAVLLLALVFVFATRTESGRAMIAGLVGEVTCGDVAITGLHGDLPDHVHADAVELHDAQGVWLHASDVALDWDVWSILFGPLTAGKVEAREIDILRRPLPRASSSSDTQFDVAAFAVSRLVTEKPVLGQRAAFAASGTVRYRSRHDLRIDLEMRRLDGAGTYRVHGAIADDILTGTARVAESGGGAAGGLVGLPLLGPVTLQIQAKAAASRNTVSFALDAGALVARGSGSIDLIARRANLEFAATAPAMKPRADLSWTALSAQGRMAGSFDRPTIAAALRIENPSASGFGARSVAADLRAGGGSGDFIGVVQQLTLPGKQPGLFAGQPFRFSARIDFEAPVRPVAFTLDHPLIAAKGTLQTRDALAGTMTVTLPALAPLAALAGIGIEGRAALNLKLTNADGDIGLVADGGIDAVADSPAGRLLGKTAKFVARAAFHGGALQSLQAQAVGAGIAAHVAGSSPAGVLNYRFDAALADLSAMSHSVRGSLQLAGSVTGAPGNARFAASGSGAVGTKDFAPERIAFSLRANGLPHPKAGAFELSGRFGGAPVRVAGTLAAAASGAFRIALDKAEWKSLHAGGAFGMAANGSGLHGKATIAWTQLGDAAPLIGRAIAGSLKADIAIAPQAGRTDAQIALAVQGLRVDDVAAERLQLSGTVANPFGAPRLALKAHAIHFALANAEGDADAAFDGPLDRLAIELKAKATLDGAPLDAAASAVANLAAHRLDLRRTSGTWKGQDFALARPATIDYAAGISIDALDATFGGAKLHLAGRLAPALALTASADNVSVDLVRLFVPELSAHGMLSGNLHATGSLAAPTGTYEVSGRDLRITGVSQGPLARFDAQGALHGANASIAAHLAAGSQLQLDIDGAFPLRPGGAVSLHANGTADLAIANAYTAAVGQTVGGHIAVDGGVAGTLAHPRFAGGFTLSEGTFSDFAHSFSLRDIQANVIADGATLRLSDLTAKAHRGTLSGSGTVDFGTPGMPVAIALKANAAEPIVSDRMTARFDGDITLSGKLTEQITLAGKVTVISGEIDLPKTLPADIAKLDVRRRGRPPDPPPETNGAVGLDLALSVPDHITVRGRGLDAALYGDLRIAGTSDAPRVLGALTLRRGTLSVAGQTLEIQSGAVGFDGESLRYRLDPTLDFAAQTTSGGVTATLKITGYASAPHIALSSTPSLPEDEVLSRLFFQQSVKQLSAVQLAEVAQALASLAGIGSGFNPVETVRKSLGLDRLAIGSDGAASGALGGATIEAGRYVANGLYLGARQNLSGGTRAVVQYDLTKNLKLQATVNTATTAASVPSTPAQDNGSSVGITYQFDY
ncbi:MAG TPA: translocation/assembly module TamB domain-containing protein [Rhizomicrobium sp.]